jgi:hypothetical protein
MKFKHLDKARVTAQAVARFDFPEIDGCPWLEIRCAGEANKAYMNAALRQPTNQRLLRGKLTVEEAQREREQAMPLYAEHVLTGNGGGWLDDESGTEVAMPLAVDARLALLRQLPVDLFDRLRVFANDLGNFRG